MGIGGTEGRAVVERGCRNFLDGVQPADEDTWPDHAHYVRQKQVELIRDFLGGL